MIDAKFPMYIHWETWFFNSLCYRSSCYYANTHTDIIEDKEVWTGVIEVPKGVP